MTTIAGLKTIPDELIYKITSYLPGANHYSSNKLYWVCKNLREIVSRNPALAFNARCYRFLALSWKGMQPDPLAARCFTPSKLPLSPVYKKITLPVLPKKIHKFIISFLPLHNIVNYSRTCREIGFKMNGHLLLPKKHKSYVFVMTHKGEKRIKEGFMVFCMPLRIDRYKKWNTLSEIMHEMPEEPGESQALISSASKVPIPNGFCCIVL